VATDPKRPYHHGDLRAALLRTAREMVEEGGVEQFSLAAAARRIGVSPRAPYRHFADRDALLTAAAAEASAELAELIEAAVDDHDGDPVEQLAAGADAYVRYAKDRAAGFDLIYRSALGKTADPELLQARRRISDLLLRPAMAAAPEPAVGTDLLENVWCLMHGYAALQRDGFFRDRAAGHPRHPVPRVEAAVRTLARGYTGREAAPAST
jgi:AcrR family transcriptional regulator